MNGDLPPIDSELRRQLARRSAGRLPEGLLVEVSAALDTAPARRPSARVGSPATWRAPRLAWAGIGAALVVAIAVAIALPASRTGPAASSGSYPSERALTTSELAAVMAGPRLPVNTTLVATVTIDVRNDVCPMNRYQTQGVVEGMASQVCVMTADVAVQPMTLTGTYALRYLAPGYLGLLGTIMPAPGSKIATVVGVDWAPYLSGRAFLVAGWLGATGTTASCVSAPAAGDVLEPSGDDCPYVDWLSDLASPISIDTFAVPTSLPAASGDSVQHFNVPMPLTGHARLVEAGGARIIDSIDPGAPRYGVYVVRLVSEPCPGDPPQSSRGCTAWRVLAKVSDVSIPAPNAASPPANSPAATTAAPPATPIVSPSASSSSAVAVAPSGLIGPGNRALTPAQLSALIAADPNRLSGRYVIDERVTCDGTDCTGVPAKPVADLVQTGGSLGLQGPVELRPDGSLVWTVPQILAAGFEEHSGALYIVDAWITGIGADSCDVQGLPCYEVSWLGPEAGGQMLNVQLGAYHEFGAGPVGGGAAIHGLFLVQTAWNAKACAPGALASIGTCSAQAQILARLEPAAIP